MATQPSGGDRDVRRRGELRQLQVLVGLGATVFSIIYILSDLIELAQGGFSPVQLALTYAAEAALPLFVLGIYALQRSRIHVGSDRRMTRPYAPRVPEVSPAISGAS